MGCGVVEAVGVLVVPNAHDLDFIDRAEYALVFTPIKAPHAERESAQRQYSTPVNVPAQ